MTKFLRFSFLWLSLFIWSAISFNAYCGEDSTDPTHGSTCTVKTSDVAAGLIYVNCAESSFNSTTRVYKHKQPAGPSDDDYVDQMTCTCDGPGGGTTVEQVYYLYAKPNPGYKFVRWTGAEESTDNPFTLTVSHSTKLPNHNPYNATAIFVADNAVDTKTNLPVGNVILDPVAPQVGDHVVATIETRTLSENNSPANKNMMVEFSHWEDGEGNKLSDNERYEFDVTAPITLVAIYRELGELPQKGKYYRVRNVYNRVLTLEGGFSVNISPISPDLSDALLRWSRTYDHSYDDFKTSTNNHEWDEYESDHLIWADASPSTIFYMKEGKVNGEEFENGVLSAQGVDTQTLTGQSLSVKRADEKYYGYFGVVATSANGAGFQAMPRPAQNGKPERCVVNVSTYKSASIYCALALQPIDEDHVEDFWFGAYADDNMELDGGYWTSMYTAFPYQLYDDGIEAFYIKNQQPRTVDGVAYLDLEKIEDGIVPANTGVLLKCSEAKNTKANRMIPLKPEDVTKTLEDNVLEGVFQLYESDPDTRSYVETRKFNSDNIRVLGVNQAGNVGFYKLGGGASTMLAANKAYIDINNLPADVRSLSLKFGTSEGSTGVESITVDNTKEALETNKVYDMYGRLVKNPQAGNLYIINGEKVLWK